MISWLIDAIHPKNTMTKRIEVLYPMRGMAALGVCLFHFCLGPFFGDVSSVTAYGRIGVEVFFVISGFILPYSLYHSGYNLRDHYGTFVLKRLVRLDPPYLVTILIMLAIRWVMYARSGDASLIPPASHIALHLGYLNAFVGYEWLNPVFWTLAIEFQYYLLLGLLFPILVRRNAAAPITVLVLSCLAPLVHSSQYVVEFLGFFAAGMAVFQYRERIIERRTFWLLLLWCTAISAVAVSPAKAAAGLLGALAITFVAWGGGRAGRFLGDISYSLYLLHIPFGGTVVSILTARLPETPAMRVLIVVIAVAASIGAATVMYRLIERPSQRISSRIRYRSAREPVPVAV